MAGERIRLEVQERELRGTRNSRRLRKEGMIPGVLYGRGNTPHPISVQERELRRVLTGGHGLHAILDVVLEGQSSTHASILKEYQVDPIRGKIEHFDLQEVRLDQPIQTAVALTLVGESAGVKEGGVLTQVATEVNIEALPLEVPQHLEIDISELRIGDTLRLSELVVPAGVTVLDDLEETVIATVVHQRTEEELAELEEDAEAATRPDRPRAESQSQLGFEARIVGPDVDRDFS